MNSEVFSTGYTSTFGIPRNIACLKNQLDTGVTTCDDKGICLIVLVAMGYGLAYAVFEIIQGDRLMAGGSA